MDKAWIKYEKGMEEAYKGPLWGIAAKRALLWCNRGAIRFCYI
jgi:hypothetical protein